VRNNWPPRPVVEDERDALAKELGGTRLQRVPSHDPPARGEIDQYPILYESELSASEASASQPESRQEDTGERRFVLIPRDDTHSPLRDDSGALPKRLPEKGKQPETAAENGRSRRTSLDPPRPLGRKKSHQDLPAIKTTLGEDPPPFRRSTSAYAYAPKADDSARLSRTSTASSYLSPDVGNNRSSSHGYFDIAAQSLPRKYGGNASSRPVTPVESVKNDPYLGYPNQDKRSGGSQEEYGTFNQGDPEKSIRQQRSAEENGSHRSAHFRRRESDEHYRPRQSSTQPSRLGHSSDSSDLDSSDSTGHRRRHNDHHQNRRSQIFHQENDRDRHNRSASRSNRPSTEIRPHLQHPSPLSSPRTSGSHLPATAAATGAAAGLFVAHELRHPVSDKRPMSRPVSPISAGPELSREDSTTPRPVTSHSRESSPVTAGRRNPISKASSPMFPPTRVNLQYPDENLRTATMPAYDEDKFAPYVPSAKQAWPPKFQPPASNHSKLQMPTASVRRFSEEIEDGTIAPLPVCPRMAGVRGYYDWMTLPNCPDFHICPTCYKSSIEGTEFGNHFVPAPLRSQTEEIVCDFGSGPWYRIAWLLSRKNRMKDLSLIYNVAEISATTNPCLGKEEAVRRWHSILDPDSRSPIRNFDVCIHCVKTIEALLPPLRGIFVRTDHLGPPGLPRSCDMRVDSKRFVHYFDALEMAADKHHDPRYLPDLHDFVELAKRYAAIPECQKDEEKAHASWYLITQLPEFTVCHECYDEVIRPLVDKRGIPAMFNLSRGPIPFGTCQLYSERMRDIFKDAVNDDDYKLLASKARERRKAEMVKNNALEDVRRSLKGKAADAEIKRIQGEWKRWE
jgi:hypothetical protein